MKRKDFQGLAAVRLKEARVLLRAGCYEGAYYLGGYVIEYALKACIAKQTQRHEFPDKDRAREVHTHGLDALMKYAKLEAALKATERTDPELNKNWRIVQEWWEQSRYERPSHVEADSLVKAIGERKHGVLRWLRRYW
jgi:HEPN domain-containing protein